MAVFTRELKANFKTLLIWALSVGGLIFLMMMLYPSMKDALGQAVDQGVYANLPKGIADTLFGTLSISTVSGFYGVEAGFMLSLGGSLFGALLGAGMLSKEESNHTAEFLFTTPVGRPRAVLSKLASIVVLIVAFNVICTGFALLAFLVVGGEVTSGFWMYQLAQFFMHLEIACICFGVSAFMRHSSSGAGLGIALVLYFCSFFSGVNDNLKFLNYITPFTFAEAGSVIPKVAIDGGMLAAGAAIAVASVVIAFAKYTRKDLAS